MFQCPNCSGETFPEGTLCAGCGETLQTLEPRTFMRRKRLRLGIFQLVCGAIALVLGLALEIVATEEASSGFFEATYVLIVGGILFLRAGARNLLRKHGPLQVVGVGSDGYPEVDDD